MKLRAIAHARAGDKGNLVNISVFAYRDEDYAMLVERVTEERVSELFRPNTSPDRLRDIAFRIFAVLTSCCSAGQPTPLRAPCVSTRMEGFSSLMLSLEI